MKPHQFVGRLDRDCEVCQRPDRDPIHNVPSAEPKAVDAEERESPKQDDATVNAHLTEKH